MRPFYQGDFNPFTLNISLLTSAHLGDWKSFASIVEELSEFELRAVISNAIGLLYAATREDAEREGQEYLDFISRLSLRGQLNIFERQQHFEEDEDEGDQSQ